MMVEDEPQNENRSATWPECHRAHRNELHPIGTSFDSFLVEEGLSEEVEAAAVAEVMAWIRDHRVTAAEQLI